MRRKAQPLSARVRVPRWLSVSLVASLWLLAPASAAGSSFANWPAYLFESGHSSTNPQATTITTANAGSLVAKWTWVPDKPLPGQPTSFVSASPTVYDGVIFIGDNTGMFYALDENTGNIIWKTLLDVVRAKTCLAHGIISTATVALDPTSGKPTVYVAGARYLYAFDAATGNTDWRKRIGPASSKAVNDYYNWSSPVVVSGHVYMGMSSECDNPLVRGGLEELSQATGAVLHTYYTVPSGSLGGSIWSSPATGAAGTQVWLTTGNAGSGSAGDSSSIVRLSAGLAKQDAWSTGYPPSADLDFGGSPTLFTATGGGTSTQVVGACNKDGYYYALNAQSLAAGPVWRFQVGDPAGTGNDLCIAAAIWDSAGGRLFVAGNHTTIGGVAYGGSVRRLDPAFGTAIWEQGLPCDVLGSPSLDGAGVLAVATRGNCLTGGTPATYLFDAATGTPLATLANSSKDAEFAQPVFADQYLLVARQTSGMVAYAPAGSV